MTSVPPVARAPLTVLQARRVLMERIVSAMDERLRPLELLAQAEATRPAPLQVPSTAQVALVGHRGSGKSRLLRLLSAWCGRPPVDLDQHLETLHGRSIRAWYAEDAASFRAAEREAFLALPPGQVVACGGGFLALHGEVLAPHATVLLPVSFETYAERLLKDKRRPRLRPELSMEEELREVYQEREELHRRFPHLELPTFLVRTLHVEKSFT